jgi:flagellin-like hook-associated protein FlgL
MNVSGLNQSARVALQAFQAASRDLAVSQSRVASGLQVASARDEGAVYVNSEGQKARLSEIVSIRDGINRASALLDVTMAGGASISRILNDMRSIALSAQSSDLSAEQRTSLQDSYDASRRQIGGIVGSVQFNGLNLVNAGGDDLSVRMQDQSSAASNPIAKSPFITRVMSDAGGVTAAFFGLVKPSFSPDGTKITDGADYIQDLSTGALTNLNLGNRTTTTAEVWSPDGSKIIAAAGIYDLTTGIKTPIGSPIGIVNAYSHTLSPDGTKVAMTAPSSWLPEDTNATFDIYIKDLTSGAFSLVSTGSAGEVGNGPTHLPIFSPDGTKLLFETSATNWRAGDANNAPDIYEKDLVTGVLRHISYGSGAVYSPDGGKIAFVSHYNITPGETNNIGKWDVYVKDLATGVTTLVSKPSVGVHQNANSGGSLRFSPDGSMLVFESDASNLVDGDTNGVRDIFLKNLETGSVTLVSHGLDGAPANGQSVNADFSPDGKSLLFASAASNLATGDANGGGYDLYIADLRESPLLQIDSLDWTLGGGGALTALSDGSGALSHASAAVSAVGALDAAIIAIGRDLADLGAKAKSLDKQNGFLVRLADVMERGIGKLVDADLSKESARVASLRLKVELSRVNLSVANQSSIVLLDLIKRHANYATDRALTLRGAPAALSSTLV